MRRIAAFMFPCAFVCAFLLGGSPPQTAPKVLAFTHVTVINATGAPALPDRTVVITGNRRKVTRLASWPIPACCEFRK